MMNQSLFLTLHMYPHFFHFIQPKHYTVIPPKWKFTPFHSSSSLKIMQNYSWSSFQTTAVFYQSCRLICQQLICKCHTYISKYIFISKYVQMWILSSNGNRFVFQAQTWIALKFFAQKFKSFFNIDLLAAAADPSAERLHILNENVSNIWNTLLQYIQYICLRIVKP